ncbi:MAG: hypothetical protein Q9195_003595 [Heterodermia aff. obscurata]
MAGPVVTRVKTEDGIEWHCERQGSGPHVILIPSGSGDCQSFAKVARVLANAFTITTFDMPGMSRTTAPESGLHDLSASKLAEQIVGLLDQLSIDKAAFYGCSSGGLAALALAADHPSRVQGVIVHEVPLAQNEKMHRLKAMDDADVVETCRYTFSTVMCEDPEKWRALGPACHQRLDKNYVTWVRHYVNVIERAFTTEELTKRPVCWTIGSLTPAGAFFQNVVDGYRAGIAVGLLPSKHYPQVTVPDVLAEHIKMAVEKFPT